MTDLVPNESTTKRGRATVMLSLLWDVGLPIIAYYGMRLIGFDEYASLLTGTIIAGVRTVYVAIKARKLDVFAAFMLGTFGVGLGLSFLTGDARFMLVKESISTGLVGLIFLITTVVGKPMIFHSVRRFSSTSVGKLNAWDDRWRTQPALRHAMRVMSVVWGCGLLLEAATRVPLVYLLPIDVMAGLGQVFGFLFIGPLIAWTLRYRGKSAWADAGTGQSAGAGNNAGHGEISGLGTDGTAGTSDGGGIRVSDARR